jgi:hypothetical protein
MSPAGSMSWPALPDAALPAVPARDSGQGATASGLGHADRLSVTPSAGSMRAARSRRRQRKFRGHEASKERITVTPADRSFVTLWIVTVDPSGSRAPVLSSTSIGPPGFRCAPRSRAFPVARGAAERVDSERGRNVVARTQQNTLYWSSGRTWMVARKLSSLYFGLALAIQCSNKYIVQRQSVVPGFIARSAKHT